jgi:uncharacterized protein involved in type VI secretion and phage assembly
MPAASSNQYFGKYRATVLSNEDLMNQGRLLLSIPDVLGSTPSNWALPCLPVTGRQMGMFAIPPLGAGVWAEFEQGDPNYPIWSGGFWGSALEVPALALAAPPGLQNICLQTTGQNTLLLTDTPGPTGGIILKSRSGAAIIVNDTGIYLTNGKGAVITMVGKAVDFNMAALTVL